MSGQNPRIPPTLDLAGWTRVLIDSYKIDGNPNVGEKLAIDMAAADLKVGPKTLMSWLHSKPTSNGPSVHVYTDNFETLCSVGRWRALNVELFCQGPEVWRPENCGNESRCPMPPLIEVGKKFVNHGRKLAGEHLAAPLILMAGPFSTEPDQIRWCLHSGFSGAETKSKLSHERQCRRSDVIVSLQEAPDLDTAYPRTRVRLLTTSFDRTATNYGLGARLGAPSNAPGVWIPRIDNAVSQISPGQVLILSIAAHVAGKPSHQQVLEDWKSVALSAAKTKARLISLNLSCAALINHQPDLAFFVEVCRTVAQILHDRKLFVKLGYLPEVELERFLLATSGLIHGVIGVNCEVAIACSLDQEDQKIPRWAEGDSYIGITGPTLFSLNKLFLDHFLRLRDRHAGLANLAIISCGGVTEVEQISTLLDMGADAVGVNSILFRDSYFGLKARRYVDRHSDRRRGRVNQEAQMIRDIWFEAYALEVQLLDPASPDYDRRHRNAIRLLDQLLRESNLRITNIEEAAAEGKRRRALLSLSEMRERIRFEEDYETN